MFQIINGLTHFVVDLQEFPPPMPINDGGDPALSEYADALTQAIEQGLITEPGKYAIRIQPNTATWQVYKVLENE